MQKIDEKKRSLYEDELLRKMLECDPTKRITSKQVVDQLKSIKEKLARKEAELLQLCARDSQVELKEIEELIRYGIDVNAKGNNGWNALHSLCRFNSSSNLADIIDLLIQSGIDVKAKSNKGWNALHFLCRFNSSPNITESIRILSRVVIDKEAKDYDGWNALHHLCCNNSSSNLVDSMAFLFSNGTDVNEKSNDGSNALHFLCRYNSSANLTTAIVMLIQSGIDVNAKNNDGENALHMLCQYNSSSNLAEAIKLLVEKFEINVKAKSNKGCNVLDYLYDRSNDANQILRILKYLRDKVEKKMEIDFDRSAHLGGGGYGQVYKGKYKRRAVAVKRVQLAKWNKGEEEIMLKLKHRNIVKLFHCESDEDFRNFALELCDASLGQLFLNPNHAQKYNGPMPRRIEVFLQLATGLKYIHLEKFAHRDIKPQNILILAGQDNSDVIIKWADFGLTKTVSERGTYTESKITGTETWLAPEIIRRWMKDEDCRGDVKSDVFALALVFGWLLLQGTHLYGSGQYEIDNNILAKNPINMTKIDSKLRDRYEYDLLKKMLEDNPGNRISSADIVKQLKIIKKELTGDEDELVQQCSGGDRKRRRLDHTEEI